MNMLKRNKFRIEERASFGLFLNENINMRPIMMLFYIFLITIFLPQFTFAQQPLTLNTENDLKVIQGVNYLDGTILFRLTKQEPNINCNSQNLYFNIIEPDGTSKSLNVAKHSIPADNFCSISKSALSKRHQPISMSANNLVKRHPECDGAKANTFECCSKYPDKCKDPKSAESACSQNPNLEGCEKICDKPGGCVATPKSPCEDNPYGQGCNVNCGSANPPPGCANVPDCGKTPGADGCANGKLDCAKYPTAPGCGATPPANTPPAKAPSANTPADCSKTPDSLGCECTTNPYGPNCLNAPDCGQNPTGVGCANLPNCANSAAKTIGCNGNKFDCTVYPRAPECLPNCVTNPFLPGCNDCTFNKNASGCDVCSQNPQASRCLTGYCVNNPDVPECSLLMTDKIKIHAITEGFILVTYFCNPSSNGDTCGSVIDWKGFEKSTITFEASCSDGRIVENSYGKGFLYVCHKYATKEVFGVVYGSPDRNGIVSIISSKTITTVETFNSDLVNVFSTESGGYCVTSSNGASAISTVFVQKDTTLPVIGPFTIYQDNTATSTQIYVCNIAYQSSGYSCVIQTSTGNQVTYREIDFVSNGTATSTVFDLSSITKNKVITGIQPLNYGGYVILTTDRTTGDVIGYVVDNKGTYDRVWDLPQGFYTSEFVLPNNTIVAIPKDASNVGTTESSGAVTIISSNSFAGFSSIEGGNGQAPGGPGGYGSSKILTTTPSRGAEISLGTTEEQEFTIIYTIPIISSTGNVSVFQFNGNNAVLKQTVSSTNGEFVSFVNDTTVKFKVLYGAIDAFNAPYYVAVDNDFVKEQSSGQNVIGIRPLLWNFTTKSVTPLTYQEGDDESAIIRLTTEGTTYYNTLSSQDKDAFAETMSDELAGAISCDRSRLSTRGFQYDGHTSQDQIILRVDIDKSTSANQPSSEKLVQDLDQDIKNRGTNSIANGNSASLLDASNGASPTEKLWKKYWGFLLAALLLFLLLTFLFIFARLRCKKGANNFLPIFLSALIPIDIAFDIAFMSLHGRDFKWVLPTTIVFFILPILLNIILTSSIIRRERARHRPEFNKWWKNNKGTANIFKTASYLDTDALQVVSSGVGGVEKLSAPFSEEGRKSILYASGAVVIFEDLPQLIIYSVYIGKHIKPAIVPILVLSSCLMVIVLKSTFMFCFTCCHAKGPEGSQGEKPLDTQSISSSSSSSDGSSNEKDEGFAPDANKTTTHDLPTRTDRPDGPQGGGPHDDGPHDRDRPSTYGNIPTGKDKPKPTDSEEKPTKISPIDKNDNKSSKKPGLSGILPFVKKPKVTTTSDIGKTDETEEIEETEEIVETTTETVEEVSAIETEANKPRIDSTIRDSTVENYDNVQKYLEATKKDDEPSSSSSGGGGYSYGAGIPVYYGLGPAPKNNNNKPDKLSIAIGASISGVTAAGGPTVRYIIIYLDDEENKGKDKPVATIKTTTTKTTSSDGEKYITRTDNGKEYITIFIDGKYITKYGSEEYITTADNEEEYITKYGSEEYITTITIITTKTITTTTSKTTTTDTTSDDNKEYITQSRYTSGKGKGQADYIVITSLTENSETFNTVTQNIETTTTTETDENGIITEIVKEMVTDEYGVTTVTVTTTKKDQSGKVIDTNVETYTEGTKRSIAFDEGNVTSEKQIETNTMTETDEYGNVIETVTEIETDENGKTTTRITTTKKDSSGKVLDTNTETIYGVTKFVTEPEETIITGDGTRTVTYNKGNDPRRKQTRTFTQSETDASGYLIVKTTTEVIEDDGSITTTVVTTKKDQNGNELESNTQTTTSYPEEETIITTSSDAKASSSKTPKRKQTRTNTMSETDENGIVTEVMTEIETDEDGKTITKVTTTRKDAKGNVIDSNVETTESFAEPTTSKTSKSIVGPSIYQQGKEKLKMGKK